MFSNEQIDIDFLPDFNDVKLEKLARNAPHEQLIGWLFTFILVFIIAVTLWYSINLPAHVVQIGSAIYSVIVIWVVFYIYSGHKKKGIAIREHDVIYRRGLIWYTTTIIPYNRIQHIELHRGFFERKLGLATLKIFSAGGLSSDLVINGLTKQRASQIKQLILDKVASEALSDE